MLGSVFCDTALNLQLGFAYCALAIVASGSIYNSNIHAFFALKLHAFCCKVLWLLEAQLVVALAVICSSCILFARAMVVGCWTLNSLQPGRRTRNCCSRNYWQFFFSFQLKKEITLKLASYLYLHAPAQKEISFVFRVYLFQLTSCCRMHGEIKT